MTLSKVQPAILLTDGRMERERYGIYSGGDIKKRCECVKVKASVGWEPKETKRVNARGDAEETQADGADGRSWRVFDTWKTEKNFSSSSLFSHFRSKSVMFYNWLLLFYRQALWWIIQLFIHAAAASQRTLLILYVIDAYVSERLLVFVTIRSAIPFEEAWQI